MSTLQWVSVSEEQTSLRLQLGGHAGDGFLCGLGDLKRQNTGLPHNRRAIAIIIGIRGHSSINKCPYALTSLSPAHTSSTHV